MFGFDVAAGCIAGVGRGLKFGVRAQKGKFGL